MQINLCYKTYECKLNLAACKSFYELTGKDLHYTLMRFLSDCRSKSNLDTEARLLSLFGIESFEVVAKLFHCLIKQVDSNIGLDEIEDGMFRVGWMPTDRDGDLSEPYPLIVVKLATDVSDYYADLDKKKATT